MQQSTVLMKTKHCKKKINMENSEKKQNWIVTYTSGIKTPSMT
jgi:hypothetical protein